MKIFALKEKNPLEKRVAITPDIVKSYKKIGFEVFIESGAGLLSGYKDEEYLDANIFSNLEEVKNADILLKVEADDSDIEILSSGSKILGLVAPTYNQQYFEKAKGANIEVFAMELVPRISRAQTMDALSSQANLAGYRSVIEAVSLLNKAVPMFMTAAGTINPARFLIIGAGVAGLQAIATAKRLGGLVYAYDVRKASKEQVESLGGKFIEIEGTQDNEGTGGYAKESGEDLKIKQREMLMKHVPLADIVITTAMIPNKPAPKMIDNEMVNQMKSGSVIVDLAALTGGNCTLTKKDEVVNSNGVYIVGSTNFTSLVSKDSSKLYSKNLFNVISHLYSKGSIDYDEEIIKAMCVVKIG